MRSRKKFGAYALPTIVLVVICMIVTSTLAFTYDKTKPVIDRNAKKTEREAASEVLGGTDGTALKEEVQSYGGTMTVMTGIGKDGKVTGVKVISNSDTPGLGSKATKPEYLSQYKGIQELKADKIKDDDQVDAITGATISSNAVYNAVKKALKEYDRSGGDK